MTHVNSVQNLTLQNGLQIFLLHLYKMMLRSGCSQLVVNVLMVLFSSTEGQLRPAHDQQHNSLVCFLNHAVSVGGICIHDK